MVRNINLLCKVFDTGQSLQSKGGLSTLKIYGEKYVYDLANFKGRKWEGQEVSEEQIKQ